ncbi:MAG: phosphotransferase [Methylotetracoccus sp.]
MADIPLAGLAAPRATLAEAGDMLLPGPAGTDEADGAVDVGAAEARGLEPDGGGAAWTLALVEGFGAQFQLLPAAPLWQSQSEAANERVAPTTAIAANPPTDRTQPREDIQRDRGEPVARRPILRDRRGREIRSMSSFGEAPPAPELGRLDSFLGRIPIQWPDFNPYSVPVSNFRHAAAPARPVADVRLDQLAEWLADQLPVALDRLSPASNDASFRRYFRVTCADQTWIAMDAPPPIEDVQRFARIATLLRDAAVPVPQVFALDADRGFMLLSDLGDTRFRDALSADSADRLYGSAIDALLRFQSRIPAASSDLPPYDEALLTRELSLFRQWFLEGLLNIRLGADDVALLERTGERLIAAALDQPRVFVHRDYHSRNLMIAPDGEPAVLDFQDAVIGPIAYDLVSLLRDCYIDWPDDTIELWLARYVDAAIGLGLLPAHRAADFRPWFDLTGMQRHMKALGIFARLNIRDGKPGYLGDMPRTLGYVSSVAQRYSEFAEFGSFIDRHRLPERVRELSR